MTIEKEIKLIEAYDKEALDIIKSKGSDYANTDVLSNFKRLSSVVKALSLSLETPTGYALFMVLLKIDRINNLISSGKEPNNESIEDSFKDGSNYLKLAYLSYIESKEQL